MAKLGDIITAIKLLTTCKSADRIRGLRDRLQSNVDELKSQLLVAPQYAELSYIIEHVRKEYCIGVTGEITWYFTSLCLALLEALNDYLDELLKSSPASNPAQPARKLQYPELPPNILSIQHQKDVQSMMQFVVMLGVCPYLLPGVGVPLGQRTKSPDATATVKQLQQANICNGERAWCLYKCCRVIVKCCNQPSLCSAIFPTHLIDIISSLLQICYGPHDSRGDVSTDRSSTKQFKSPADITPDVVASGNVACRPSISEEQRELSGKFLYDLLTKMYPPIMVRQLLSIQGMARTSSAWAVKGCGRLLSQQLMKSHGVKVVIEAVFSDRTGAVVMGSSQDDWKKAEAVAKIIARCPSQVTSLMEYYSVVCPQVLSLLQDDKCGTRYMQVSIATTNSMMSENKSLTIQYITTPLLQPLHHLTTGSQCSRGQLLQTVKVLDQVCSMPTTSSPILPLLVPYLIILVKVFLASGQHVKSGTPCDPLLYKYTRKIIVVLLKSVDDNYCVKILCSLLYGPAPGDVITVSGDVVLQHRDSVVQTEVRNRDSTSMETFNKFLQDLFVELNNKSLEAAVFLNCFQFLSNNLLQLEPPCSEYERGVVLYVVADMCEHKMEKILHQLGSTQLLKMSSQLLKCHCGAMSNCKISVHDDQSSSLDNQVFGGQITMSIALGIVTMVMTCSQSDNNDVNKEELTGLLPLLEKVSTSYPVEELRQMAGELRICVATLGAVKGGLATDQSPNTHKTLIEEVIPPSGKINDSNLNPEADSGTPFQCALKEVQDPLIPVRGHGVQMLSKLVRSKDPETLKNISKLLEIFCHQLSSSDSYVYLRAVTGLAALASIRPAEIIPLLCKEFTSLDDKDLQPLQDDNDLSGDASEVKVRLKVGEVLVKVAGECGEMLPHYSNHFLSAIMNAVRDKDPLVQASSLSGLATVCEHMGYSLGTVQHEVIKCISDVLVTSSNQPVKSAAIQTLSMILEGLGSRSIEVLGDSLHDIYKLLKRSATLGDAITTEHAHAALDQLDTVMKDNLFGSHDHQLTKNISILHK